MLYTGTRPFMVKSCFFNRAITSRNLTGAFLSLFISEITKQWAKTALVFDKKSY